MKIPACVAVFLLTAGAIAWGVLTDVREAKLQTFLTSIEAAEQEMPYVGTRVVGGAERVKMRIWSRDGRKKVDFLGFEGASKPAPRGPGSRPLFGPALPMFLRPGQDQWKRKIKDAALAVRNYDIAVTGRDTVAGRACEILEVRSRHEGRPSYRVAADLENRFPLRFEVLAGGKPVFETWFSEIEYRPSFPAHTFDERFRPNWLKVTQKEVPAERMADAAGFAVLRPTALPAGFELRGSEVLRLRVEISKELRETVRPFLPFPMPDADASVAHFTYTDGLAVVALVECSASSELWQHLKKYVPAPTGPAGDSVVARKFSDRGGTAYLLEHEGTVVLAAGNIAAEDIESMIRTLERR
jgi:negative regulator of sigma E activity